MVIFYDGSLEWYLDHTPGSQQWITSQPLHRHDGVDEEDAQAKVFKGTRQKTDISAEFSFKDLPVGTSIIREQTEYTVQQTTIDSSGKKSVGPEEVTMSRSYTLDIPGVDRVTGIRRWRKSPQQAGTPSTSTKAVANADKTNSIEAKSTGKAIEAVSELTLTKRNPAGKDSDLETPTADISRMPPLISRIAYLKNKNLMESDGKT
uniref:S-layer homology domain-containing protein n=1 Tax=Angiostrongylus cantonensis TaxID=6313 RepID=A0A0K0DD12_ANGCA